MAMAFVTDLTTEAQYKSEITDTPGTLQVIEVYQPWCGPSKAVQSTFKRLYFDLNDRPLKFYSVGMWAGRWRWGRRPGDRGAGGWGLGVFGAGGRAGAWETA
ncbi:Dynein light chain, flagellar outer arm [Tetrabaena socialis]|uniref:Dynein light chain, flagellar outer arm n=1 Tax=Tetrabaena socialis TaxID=47790 RepID=A0A2J7ZZ63_9CHLO|nr:Dynein light chain, flagellar outer arm [Tetrabaena socialis]|eukprot:PNH05552.1 Dynein light chain, flagellar outer arm [Tetrabaena socialis]